MLKSWEERSVITAHLLNPAFCGEVLRRTVDSYNSTGGRKFPFAFSFLILPILLHKKTREAMPVRSSTYFHSWVSENDHLFMDFPQRTKNMVPYTKESLMFLLANKAIKVQDNGTIIVEPFKKKNHQGAATEEVSEIYRKCGLLGKWLQITGNEQTIFMFLQIKP